MRDKVGNKISRKGDILLRLKKATADEEGQKISYFSVMFLKKALLFLLIVLPFSRNARGQQGDFCNAVSTILRDAPNKFRNIKGKLQEANANATMWASGVQVPGTIGSRFVFSMGLFYEGALLQTKNKADLKAVYDKYRGLLNDCLAPQGYKVTLSNNFYSGLAEYKKVVFMLDAKDEPKPPAHVTMEATYNKDVDKYTVVMYIFEH